MNSEDLELQMPSELRGDAGSGRDPASAQPFLQPSPYSELAMAVSPKRRGILHMTVETPAASYAQKSVQTRPLALWRTPEFYFYYVVFATVVPLMIWKPISLSRGVYILLST